MAQKKKSTSRAAEKKLRAKLVKARAKRKEAEASAQKWKKRAKAGDQDVAGLQAELSVVRRRLATAEAAIRPSAAARAAQKTPAKRAAAKKAPAKKTATRSRAGATRPDDSWTVTALRAEARSRGLAGYSRQSKSQLVAALRG